MRCLHTDEFVYIRNYLPDRWPAGDPEFFGDIDASPTKAYMQQHRDQPGVRELFALAFGKRPAEELYALRDGYACLTNLAEDPTHEGVRTRLRERLDAILTRQGDPRQRGLGVVFETYPYFGPMVEKEGWPSFPGFAQKGQYNPGRLGRA